MKIFYFNENDFKVDSIDYLNRNPKYSMWIHNLCIVFLIFACLIAMSSFAFGLEQNDTCENLGYNLSLTADYDDCNEFWELLNKHHTINNTQIINNTDIINRTEVINNTITINDTKVINNQIETVLNNTIYKNNSDIKVVTINNTNVINNTVVKYINNETGESSSGSGSESETLSELEKEIEKQKKIVEVCEYNSELPVCEEYLNPEEDKDNSDGYNMSEGIQTIASKLNSIESKVQNPEPKRDGPDYILIAILGVLMFGAIAYIYTHNYKKTPDDVEDTNFDTKHYIDEAKRRDTNRYSREADKQ